MAISKTILAQILFAETADMTPDQNGPGGLTSLRTAMAELIYIGGNGKGFAAAREPTSADFGIPERLAAWQSCVAVAEEVAKRDPKPGLDSAVIVLNDVAPWTVRALLDAYSWLTPNSTISESGPVLDRGAPLQAWVVKVGKDVAPGRYPQPSSRPLVTATSTMKPAIGTAIACVLVSILLLGISAWLAGTTSRGESGWMAAPTSQPADGAGIFVTLLGQAREQVDTLEKTSTSETPIATTPTDASLAKAVQTTLAPLAIKADEAADAFIAKPNDKDAANVAKQSLITFFEALRRFEKPLTVDKAAAATAAEAALEKLIPALSRLAFKAGETAAAAIEKPEDADAARAANQSRIALYDGLQQVPSLAERVARVSKNGDDVRPSAVLREVKIPDLTLAGAVSFLAVVFLLVGTGIGLRGNPVGALVDDRGRMSLSRLQLACWTIVILGGYWTLSFWNLGAGATGTIHLPALQPDLWMLLGVVTASPLVSTMVLSGRRNASESTVDAAGGPQVGATAPPHGAGGGGCQ